MSILQRKKGTKQQTLLIFVWCVLNPWILSKSIQIFHQPIKNNSWNIPGKTITSEEIGRKQLKWNKKIIRIRIRYSHNNEKRTKNNPKKIWFDWVDVVFPVCSPFFAIKIENFDMKIEFAFKTKVFGQSKQTYKCAWNMVDQYKDMTLWLFQHIQWSNGCKFDSIYLNIETTKAYADHVNHTSRNT